MPRRYCSRRLCRIHGSVRTNRLISDHWVSLNITIISDAIRVFRIHNITDEEAVLVEPTSCALHAMDRLRPGDKVGIDALVIGAGPSGLVLAQLLKLNGAANVVIAAPAGPKMEIAKRLEAGDQYIELDRDHPELGWKTLQTTYSRGFNVVVSYTRSILHASAKYLLV